MLHSLVVYKVYSLCKVVCTNMIWLYPGQNKHSEFR